MKNKPNIKSVNEFDYDIIIAGAGPSGLSVAHDLSKDFKILLIDKRKIPYTTSAWYSYEDRVKKNNLDFYIIEIYPFGELFKMVKKNS